MSENKGICPCCGRMTQLTFHHLIPKKMHRRPYFRKHVSREARAAGIHICRQCHNGIHRFYDEMTLAKTLNSLERLTSDEALMKYFAWVAKQRVSID